MENCQNCGAPLSGQPFCTSCGMPVAAPPTQPLPSSGPPPAGPPPGLPAAGGGSNKLLFIILAVVGVLILAGGGVATALMLTSGDDKKDKESDEVSVEKYCDLSEELGDALDEDDFDEAHDLVAELEELGLPEELEDVEEGALIAFRLLKASDSEDDIDEEFGDLDEDDVSDLEEFGEANEELCDDDEDGDGPSATTTQASGLEGFCEISVELDAAGDDNDFEAMRDAYDQLDEMGLPSELSGSESGFDRLGELITDSRDMEDLESSYLDLQEEEMDSVTDYFENLESECEAIGISPDDAETSATAPSEPSISATPETSPSDPFEGMPSCTDYVEQSCQEEWNQYFETSSAG